MSPPARLGAADTSEAVDRFMAQLEHPLKDQVAHLRTLILAAAPEVAEGVKWNSPSFRTAGYFATINLRYKGGIAVILHLGAKARDQQVQLADPAGLLAWLGPERAAIAIDAGSDLDAIGPALQEIVRQWIRWV